MRLVGQGGFMRKSSYSDPRNDNGRVVAPFMASFMAAVNGVTLEMLSCHRRDLEHPS